VHAFRELPVIASEKSGRSLSVFTVFDLVMGILLMGYNLFLLCYTVKVVYYAPTCGLRFDAAA